ncbi:hypothetical protein A2765_02020 [Candidatus Kaiserbacteria bacterium RIFCSPHIGHO2_01_FULL_56_24]|uniref:Peptidoglycan binding-like domain-containing protein n=1 Tax=Candidatus Kaiserbacteria bacterium RIFCSPHIGHO2_01_FULL_56_24 TaxID=1798487 RepID=A0A1F6DAY3_9BACT|nr:MAG: hypothetical protein A2765_02020 [Candidatus Kaiserbacteria bacterium RIFCSPHIGHO2_01_FULL_56_24]
MKNMLRAMAITPFLALTVFSVAHAQSSTDLQAQLNALLAQLSALQSQLQTSSSSNTAPAATPGASGQCPTLSRALRQGMSGSDVTGLQAFLATDSSVYPEATVSGYFGALTQAAVQRFQARHLLVSSGTPDTTGYGAVGPATRAAIAGLCKSGSVPTTTSVPGGNCSQGGLTAVSGLTADFYSVTAAPLGSSCASNKTTRQCVNGNFSGNPAYQYGSCSDTANQCIVNSVTIANGVSQQFYSRSSVNTGDACSSYTQTRTCTNGVMTGASNFMYSSCIVDVPDSCSVGGIAVAHGSSRTFYTQDLATSTVSCSAYGQSRTCNDGVLSGSGEYSKPSCTAGACFTDGVTFQSGSTTTFYFAKNIPSGEQCSSYAQTRSCVSGTFTGNAAYKYTSCVPAAAGTCVTDSVVLTSGQAWLFYSTTTAAVGTTCGSVSQLRTCTNGTLGGTASFNRTSCSDTKLCPLAGVNVPHGDSYTFYNAQTVDFGSTCSSEAQTRTCSNGKFSGSDSYQYANCSVNPPLSGMGAAQLAAALTALQSILQSLLDKLDSWF